jgi:ATP-dependent helicase HrpB
LDAPPPGALRRAETLLAEIGAIDAESRSVTETGRRMLAIAAPPRLARLLVEAQRRDCTEAGALLAALASERDICAEERAFGEGSGAKWPAGPSDLLLRAELFEEAARANFGVGRCRSLGLDPRALRAVDRTRRQMLRALGGRVGAGVGRGEDVERLLACIVAGFPDRVARRRARGSVQAKMVGGSGVVLSERSVVRDAELFVAIDVEAGRPQQNAQSLVRIASAVDRGVLERMFPDSIRTARELVFDSERERVVERTSELYLDLVLAETVRLDVDAGAAGEALAAAALRDLERAVTLDDTERSFLERLGFLRRFMPELGLQDDGNDLVAQTIRAACSGRRSFAELRKVALLPLLAGLLTHSQKTALDREALSHYRLPNDRLAAIVYERDKPPSVAARIQELFGLTATPRLAASRVPLVLELLGPNFRPVQITDDLESFWRRTYPEVRKDLRGRYPKHAWPEDPLTARPAARRR